MINDYSQYIENLSQYISWVVNLKETEGSPSFPIYNIYFRGHASEKWILKPYLFRENVLNEHDIFVKASNRCWSEVKNFSNLEKLVFFQHFGLQTRLLDVTSNPLVALYFACQKEGDEDGQVRYGYCDRFDNETVNIIADIIAEYDMDQIYLSNEWLQTIANKYNKYNKRSGEILGQMLSIPYYVDAPYNSSRIVAQRGSLLIPPLLVKNEFGYSFVKEYDFDSADENNSLFGKSNIIIKNIYKEQILNELKRVGIDDYSIFPDTSHLMTSINKEMKLHNIEVV